MSTAPNTIEELVNHEYKYGFYTEIQADSIPRGLNENIIRMISEKSASRKQLGTIPSLFANTSAR